MKAILLMLAALSAPSAAQPALVAPKCHDPQIWPVAIRAMSVKAYRYGGDPKLNSAFLPVVIDGVMQFSQDSVTAHRVCYGKGKDSFGKGLNFAFQVRALDSKGRYIIEEYDEGAALLMATGDPENAKRILRRDQPTTMGKPLLEKEAREAREAKEAKESKPK